jgi:hypothetical protein
VRPRDHVILGSAASVGLYFYLGAGALHNVIFFWMASILIDIDHYLDYIYNNRFTDYSFKRMMAYHGLLYKRRFDPAFINLSIFHCVESMGALLITALYTGSTVLLYIWWGFLFHIVFDTIKLVYDGKPSIRSNTIIGYFFRVRRLRLQGFDTKAVYTRAASEVRGNCGS